MQEADGAQKEFTAAELAASLAARSNPALDANGHGTPCCGDRGRDVV